MPLPISHRIAIHYTRSPDAALTLAEVAQRFGVKPDHARSTLRYSIERGLLERAWYSEPGNSGWVYVAGPALRGEL